MVSCKEENVNILHTIDLCRVSELEGRSRQSVMGDGVVGVRETQNFKKGKMVQEAKSL